MINFLDLPITGILLAVFLIGGIAGIFLIALWDWWSEPFEIDFEGEE